jgi:hypothetical protein
LTVGNGIPCTPGIVPDDTASVSFFVTSATGIISTPVNSIIGIYPNPSSGKFTVKNLTSEESILKIFSADGKLVNEYKLTDNETLINSSLSQGIYTAIIENENHYSVSKFVVIN